MGVESSEWRGCMGEVVWDRPQRGLGMQLESPLEGAWKLAWSGVGQVLTYLTLGAWSAPIANHILGLDTPVELKGGADGTLLPIWFVPFL